MTDTQIDMAATLFILPPDAKVLPVSDLSARLRARIGPVDDIHSVITRPGYRVTTRLIPGPLADLLGEFATPSLLTDAVLRFARTHGQDPMTMLDMAFDALATLVESRILVPHDSPDASAPVPSLGAGQEFAGYEINALVRSLEDSEVYQARGQDGGFALLKISREDRPAIGAALANEARLLERLAGIDSPGLLDHGTERGLTYVAMEWCDGVSIAVAAQQVRTTRDRRRLHDLVSRMLDAYGRLHSRGVLHGDIHPGNCLVRDDGRIVILDFGNARLIDSATMEVDPARVGIPHFHDPQMAAALLAGRLPPAATPVSEQYAIAVLAYLLLTGLHPIEAPAIQEELLRRIVERPPLPFAARGIAAWPDVEAVIKRALAKQPDQRFIDVAAFARAFASADLSPGIPRRHPTAQAAFDAAVEAVRNLVVGIDSPLDSAWFGLRAALAFEDAELLAAADILARRAGSGWAAQWVAANVARARSDSGMVSKAIAKFLTAAEPLPDGPQVAAAILAAASILEDPALRTADGAALGSWAAQRLNRLALAASSTEHEPFIAVPLLVHAELSLSKSGVIPVRADLPARLEALKHTQPHDVWLWSLAHEVLADERYKAIALAARLPRRPLWRGFALLRLHQLTGDTRWVIDAHRTVARAPNTQLPVQDTVLLMTELMVPERAILPPYRRKG